MKICIWTGAAFEPWDPESINTGGIGGSETAAVHMSRELASLGHEVVMFGEHIPGLRREIGTNGKFVDVQYMHFKSGLQHPEIMECDVFVSSRDKRVLRLKPPAKVKVLWVHDVHVGDDWENEVPLFDRVYCLTNWHRGYFVYMYPHVDPDRIQVTRNGIDPRRFAPEKPWREIAKAKRPNFTWTSSLDRGLDVMLDIWPEIKKLEPAAELDIFYGIDNWRKLNAENPTGLKVIDFMMGRIESMASQGVHFHGRVGQNVVANMHMSSMVWAYPTAWLETSCITALEAQAGGSLPVTSNLAALTETVKYGTLINGRNKSDVYKKSFLESVGAALDVSKTSTGSSVACAARDWALTQTWSAVAVNWLEDFSKLLEGK